MSGKCTYHTTTASHDETIKLGACMGDQLSPGLTLGLVGQLGTGKTALVKGIAKGNNIPDHQQVTSPTFTLINEYTGRVPMYHLDAYRLKNPGELVALGIDEMIAGDATVIVEWADRVISILPADMVWIEITSTGEQTRTFHLRGLGEQACTFVEAMRRQS